MTQAILLNHNTAVRAKVIAVRTSSRMVDGISKALLIEQLKRKLRSGQIVKFAYLKSNGDIRVAYGTTNVDFVKDKIRGWGESRENYATTAYYDLEKGGWRSFRWENLIAGILAVILLFLAIPHTECCSSENNFLSLWRRCAEMHERTY